MQEDAATGYVKELPVNSIIFLVTSLLVPVAVAAVATVWFFIGGVRDLRRLFHDLEARLRVDDRDNGRVE